MPRVHTQKAAKDYPEHGIKKGDIYYSWSFRYGGSRKSKTRPKPSQLTQSKMSAAMAAVETLEEGLNDITCVNDVEALLSDAAEAIRDVAQEYEDGIDNMPEGLQDNARDGDVGQKIESLREFADELENTNVSAELTDFWEEANHDGKACPDDLEFEALTGEEQNAFREAVAGEINLDLPC